MSYSCTALNASLYRMSNPQSSLKKASPTNMSLVPISQISHVRPEWEVIDPESGTCTTQVYLSPDEHNGKEDWSQVYASTPISTANTATLPSTTDRRPYWDHLLISQSPTSASVAMSKNHSRPDLESSEKGAHFHSTSTPLCLRGDGMVHIPQRAISLGDLPLTPASPTTKAPSRAYTSMLMAGDITMANSATNHSTEAHLSHPPLVHSSSLIDKSAVNFPSPKSPRVKFIPTFPSLNENSTLNIKTDAYRRLLLSTELPVLTTMPKLANPFVIITRENDSVDVRLRYNTMPIYSITVEPGSNNRENYAKRKQVTGPYRSAAMWEFIGQTFSKYERHKKLKPKKRRVIRDSLDRATPPSSLSNEIVLDNDEDKNVFSDTEIRAEWTSFVNSTDNSDHSPSRHASRPLRSSGPNLAYEKDHSDKQSEDGRGRARTRANLGRYSMEKMPPASGGSTPVVPPMRKKAAQETDIGDEWGEITRSIGGPAVEQQESGGLGLCFW